MLLVAHLKTVMRHFSFFFNSKHWRHQGGAWGHFPPRRRLCPPLPLLEEKNTKISHFRQIFGFLPSQNRIWPLDVPHQKISGATTDRKPEIFFLNRLGRKNNAIASGYHLFYMPETDSNIYLSNKYSCASIVFFFFFFFSIFVGLFPTYWFLHIHIYIIKEKKATRKFVV